MLLPAFTKSSTDFSPSNHLRASRSASLSVDTEIVTGPSVSSVVEGDNVTLISV